MRHLSLASGLAIALAAALSAQTNVRVATYNIQFLNAGINATRKANLHSVIEHLDADVIGLQEIADRPALEVVFPPQDWLLVIDEDSGSTQDVALAVRKPWTVEGVDADLDADDQNFLFPGAANDSSFPNRRDVLAVSVKSPSGDASFTVMVVHAKARVGGRPQTDPRRVAHSVALVNVIKDRFDDTPFVILGDWNDNPDDQSMNVLETGDANALGGPENIDGPLMINLAEALLLEDRVSHGLNSAAIVGGAVNTADAGSRARNNTFRGTDTNTGKILFDQLLIPAWWSSAYVAGSIQVYSFPDAVQGNSTTRASDHVPVFADFVLSPPAPPAPAGGLFLSALVPNPAGTDDNHEQVALSNPTGAPIDLAGWKVQDVANNEFALAGTVPAHAELTITMQRTAFLNNSGDTVFLVNPAGQRVQTATYSGAQAQSGARIAITP